MNKPFAYSLYEYTETLIFPTLEKAVNYLKAGKYMAYICYQHCPVFALYDGDDPDLRYKTFKNRASLLDFIENKGVSEEKINEIKTEARKRIEKSKVAYQKHLEWQEKERQEGRSGVGLSGSYRRWLKDEDFDELVKNEVDKISFVWKEIK